jgi:hypothetical protein
MANVPFILQGFSVFGLLELFNREKETNTRVKVNFEIHKTIRIVSKSNNYLRTIARNSSINQSINQSSNQIILESVGGKMSSLQEAAQHGELDECRRLVEEEGKDVNEINVVNICMISTCIN